MNDEYNAAEPQHVKDAKRAAKLAAGTRRDVLRGIMSVSGGRQWMHEVLLRCHVFSSTYTGEALSAAFMEGERNIGLQILTDIAPEDYALMMREAHDRHIAADTRRARDTEPLSVDDSSADEYTHPGVDGEDLPYQ